MSDSEKGIFHSGSERFPWLQVKLAKEKTISKKEMDLGNMKLSQKKEGTINLTVTNEEERQKGKNGELF